MSTTSDIRWRPVKASQPASVFLRFEEPGQSLEGTWLGWGVGPFGDVDAGTLVKLTFVGWNTSKSGRRYRVFEVLVGEGQ